MQKRHQLVFMAFLAIFICYMDRVAMSVAIIPMVETYGWDLSTQGLVLSSFFIGYLLTQVIGGKLADLYGGKVVLGFGVLIWSLFTLVAPPAAALGIAVLIVARILMGMGEAVTFPAIYALYARWIPVRERSRSAGFSNSGIPLGTVFALLATPIIVAAWGWEWVFYIFGSIGFGWCAVWYFLIAANPRQQAGISQTELDLIATDSIADGPAVTTPWRALMTSMPVWAIIVAHFCNNWWFYVLLAWLPTFVTKGLGVDYAAVGFFAMMPHIALFLFINISGVVADRLIGRGMTITHVRKLMMLIGSGGSIAALLLVGQADNAVTAITIMTIGSALGAFAVSGFFVNHMDIAPEHAGTLMGITNTAGTIPGIIGVLVSGWILDVTGSWALVFQVSAAVAAFGLVFYLIFGSGERQFEAATA
ncbi:ACS family MFS transporter [Parasphingorhabdus sp.]|uniref:ACS family MFS transporter n=1 Tax=Parasphingorhabdus sp. TaxID=2709688 RepID=UPI003593235A